MITTTLGVPLRSYPIKLLGTLDKGPAALGIINWPRQFFLTHITKFFTESLLLLLLQQVLGRISSVHVDMFEKLTFFSGCVQSAPDMYNRL